MNRIMLDLETMGNGSDAAIVSIGAVRFDVDDGVMDTFHIGVGLPSSIAAGGVVDGSTVIWWLGQKKEAQDRLLNLLCSEISGALEGFSKWATKDGALPIDEIWGCGATADNVWLSNAYKRLGRQVPWTYRADRCYRTLRELFPFVAKPNFVGVEHDGLDDAKHQARHLIKILRHIRSTEPTRETPASN